jgi:hypothetical protein
MPAAKRDHAMQQRMVADGNAVECPAKIAMTALPSRPVATRLLPKQVWQRRIFVEADAAWICSL